MIIQQLASRAQVTVVYFITIPVSVVHALYILSFNVLLCFFWCSSTMLSALRKTFNPGEVINEHMFSIREAIAEARWAESTKVNIKHMLKRLLSLSPMVLPFSSISKVEAAIIAVLISDDKKSVASKASVENFKQAAIYYHFVMGIDNWINLDHPTVQTYLQGIVKAHIVLPKNLSLDATAQHGHSPLPAAVWRKTVEFLFERSFESHPEYSLALFRDLTMLTLNFGLKRRPGEICKMSVNTLFDKGFNNGFDWIINGAKTSQTTRIVVPISEFTDSDVPLALTLRRFLLIAPKDGFIFRQVDASGLAWAPSTKQGTKQSIFGSKNCLFNNGITPQVWKRQFQRRLLQACPELGDKVKLYTPHACRSGGAMDALDKGLDMETVRQMLCHKSMDSTRIYTRCSKRKLAEAFSC